MIVVEVQTQVRVASGVKAIVVQAADRVEPLDSECTTGDFFISRCSVATTIIFVSNYRFSKSRKSFFKSASVKSKIASLQYMILRAIDTLTKICINEVKL